MLVPIQFASFHLLYVLYHTATDTITIIIAIFPYTQAEIADRNAAVKHLGKKCEQLEAQVSITYHDAECHVWVRVRTPES